MTDERGGGSKTTDSQNLRSRAERVLAGDSRVVEDMSTAEISSLIHELQVHQIELEIQTEELRRSQAEAVKSYRRYRELWEGSPQAYLTLDAKGRINEVNYAGRVLFGRPQETLHRTRLVSLIKQEDQVPLHLMLERTAGGSVAERREAGVVQPDGTIRTCLLVCQATEGVSDQESILVTLTDITDRKGAEAALKKREEQLRLALESGLVGLWDRNMVTNEIEWSDELYELLGRDPSGEPITGETFFDYIHPGDLPRVRTQVEEWFKGGGVFQDEFRIVRENGQVRWLASFGRLHRNDAGEIIRLLGINYDTTEHKLREEDLRQARTAADEANRSKDQFLANMSHELRTPLSGIMGLADVLESRLQKPENLHYVNLIKESAQSLTELLGEVLDSAKIQSGELIISDRPFNVRRKVGKVIDLFKERAKAGGNLIHEHMDLAMPAFLSGDAERLEQILRNLISNAVKFTQNGVILIGTDCQHEAPDRVVCTFKVQDTGPGIPEDKQKFLFEDFYQVENHLTKEHPGTGLGLSIAKKLAEAMNGRIWVESHEGLGTTFFLEISFGIPHEQMETDVATSSALDLSSGQALHILVAEDNRINQLYLKKMLENIGHQVVIVDNGQTAMEELHRSHFDVVFMDIQMPVMDGYAAIRHIRESDMFNQNIPIFALTAYASAQDVEKALKSGADGHIVKPVDFDNLKLILKKIAGGLGVEGSTPSENWFPTYQAVLDRYSKNPALHLELCQNLISDLPERLNEIKKAVSKGHFAEAARECHSLAGLGATIGDENLWRAGLEYEAKFSTSFTLADYDDMEKMKKTTAQTKRHLETLIDQLTALQTTHQD